MRRPPDASNRPKPARVRRCPLPACILVADYDELLLDLIGFKLTARGYRFNEEPYDVPVGRLVTINDPDGNIVGLEDRSKGGLAGVGG